MNAVCPGCGRWFEVPAKLKLGPLSKHPGKTVESGPTQLEGDGTAFRALDAGEERHIDMRIRCERCAFHQR